RRIGDGVFPPAAILLYHRVIDLHPDPQWLGVTPGQFAEHLEILSRDWHPIHLSDLVDRVKTGTVPRRAVVVTFDDGYADNLHEAKPLLDKHGIPATVFVTTGMIGADAEFWWDELGALLLESPVVSVDIRIRINGREHRWHLSGDASGSPRWNVAMHACPTPRHAAYRELAPLMRDLHFEQRDEILDTIAGQIGVPRSARPTHRCMTREELAALAGDGLIEIGAHTVHHPVLSTLPVEAQRDEIVRSRETLESILPRPVRTFSYPFGCEGTYTPATVRLIQEAGYHCACSNFEGLVRKRTDRYQLPRFLVRDWDGDFFSRRLKLWMEGEK
ncbi:MAG: polysaccharide deacetylase family protein, partial [Chthoniobacteraceae bacterium]